MLFVPCFPEKCHNMEGKDKRIVLFSMRLYDNS